MTTSTITTFRGTAAKMIAASLLLIVLAACSAPDQSAIVPLVAISEEQMNIAAYDNESITQRLDQLPVELMDVVASAGSWGKLTSDMLNPILANLTFISSSKNTLAYGYGTESTSMLSISDYSIFTMAGDSGNCWAIKITDGTGEPTVLRSTMFAPECRSDLYDNIEEHKWSAPWPAPAVPESSGSSTTLP